MGFGRRRYHLGDEPHAAAPEPPRRDLGERPGVSTALVTLLLFLLWSNSFVAAAYLLGGEGVPGQLDWLSITVARFLPIVPACAAYCLWRRRETLAVLREHWARLLVCGNLAVGYCYPLYSGQQRGVPAAVASLITTLVPLFTVVLAAMFLGERLTRRRVLGFLIAFAGMAAIAAAKREGAAAGIGYGGVVAVTATAPLCWALFSILSKPVTAGHSPLLWTYLSILVGSVPLLLVAPFRGGAEMLALDAGGWVAVLYLGLPCTLLGYAIWTWLLRRLPASSVGFTAFLNPPLTTLSKVVLASALPAVFVFSIAPLEWAGGALALAGMALAVTRSSPARRLGG